MVLIEKDKKEKINYKCGFCGFKFLQRVGKVEGMGNIGGKTRHVSSQVKCRNCGNFIKTWGN